MNLNNIADHFLPELMTDRGLVLMRNEYGVWTNALHLVMHHSPTGFEWGYAGSGPADLALNVVEMILHQLKYTGPRLDCFDGECFEMAWTLHQPFKRQFITPVPLSGGAVPYALMRDWVAERIRQETP